MLRKLNHHTVLLDWYAEHYAGLYEYGCAVTADPGLTKDLLHELFHWLLEHPASVAKVQEPKGYLMRSLHNNIRKHYHGVTRLKKRTKQYGEQPREVVQEPVSSRLELAEREQLRKQVLSNCLDSLTPRQREIVYLRYYREMAYTDIASMLGIQEQVARNTTSRAMKTLREFSALLRDHCFLLALFCYFV